MLSVLLAGILGTSAAWAQAPRGTARKAEPQPVRTQWVEISIPYPNAGMYLYRGIYGSFAGGSSWSTSADSARGEYWRDPLFQWQGEVAYFYTHWFSGGFGFRINAGEPSDSAQQVFNRYFLMTRFHRAWPKAAAYAGLSLGVDDVSISLTSLDTLNFKKPLQETNAALGVEAGAGWKFSKYVGATLGQRMDVSLVRQDENHARNTLAFRTQPGFAVDMCKVAPSLRENVKALYLLVELQFGQVLQENGDSRSEFAWITGLSLAF
jgi:hypothetical protein